MKRKIYDDGDIRIVQHIPENILYEDVIFITFQTFTGRLSDRGFGTSFLEKLGIENFFVSHRGLSFYQKLSLELFRDLLIQFVSGKRVFLYGSSLGGYASIYYSGAVNGQAIALSPRCSADPIYNESYDDLVFSHCLMHQMPLDFISEHHPVIAYDPHVDKDELYIKNRVLPLYSRSKVVKIYDGLHPVGPVMKNSGVLKDFVISTINKSHDFDSSKIDCERNPAYSLKKARYSLRHGDRKSLNYYIFKCLEWGGVPALIPIVREAIEYRVLDYDISSKDIPENIKLGFIRKIFKRNDECSYQECIDLHLFFFDYSAALSVLTLKETKFGVSVETRKLREKILGERNWLSKLSPYRGRLGSRSGGG